MHMQYCMILYERMYFHLPKKIFYHRLNSRIPEHKTGTDYGYSFKAKQWTAIVLFISCNLVASGGAWHF